MEALMDGVVEPSDEVFASIADEAARLKRLALRSLQSLQERGGFIPSGAPDH